MRKSSSAQLFPLDFNPKEFRVGQSRIDQLPVRRHSASQIHTLTQPGRQEVEQLRKQNCLLQRENEQLRREVEGFKLQSTVGTVCRTQAKVSSYKDVIRDKLSSRAKQSRNTQCQTRLLDSKEVSLERSSLTISDYYDQYKLVQKVPALLELREIGDVFFQNYCNSYAKLRCLFECLQCSKQSESYKTLESLIDLYKVPLLYQKSPQTLLREISKSKEKLRTKGREESKGESKAKKEQGKPKREQSKPRKEQGKPKREQGKPKREDVCAEQWSPSETALRIEGLLGKVCRSGQMLRVLRTNETVLRFVHKIQERQ